PLSLLLPYTTLFRSVADRVLEAPRHPGDAGGPVGVEADVAQVAGAADVALDEAPVTDDRAAHARAQREQHRVAGTRGGALPGLAHEGGVGVVQDPHRHAG